MFIGLLSWIIKIFQIKSNENLSIVIISILCIWSARPSLVRLAD